MALAASYDSLRREIGRFLGYRPSTSDWSSTETQNVADILDGGLRRFYWPTPPHAWSFLSPNATLPVNSSAFVYQLPDDFSDISSKGFAFSVGAKKARVSRVSEEAIKALRSQANRTGEPQFFCVTSRANLVSNESRYDVWFYPTPDASYSLEYSYSVIPDSLSTSNTAPLGGARHSETITEACLAEAERKLGDEDGIHEKRFRELLDASIKADAPLAQPATVDVWPFEDEVSGLKVTKAYLKRIIGEAMGYGPHPGLWDHTQQQKVKLILENALRKFYSPPILPNDKYAHNWSFLKQQYQFELVQEQYTYDLPEGFAMLSGDEILYEPGVNQLYPPIRLVSERQVMQQLQRYITQGRPQLAAYRVKPLDQASGTRYELLLWPKPSQEYTLFMRYTVNPGMMSEEACLPYGQQSAMRAIVEACLSAVEESKGELGLHSKLFLESLASAVGEDRKVSSPDTLGYNSDPSDLPMNPVYGRSYHHYNTNIVTYGGETI
jgi:hypothetical protein